MEDLRERIAYLQGLAEGLKFAEGDEQSRVIKKIIDILGDLVDEVEELRVGQEDIEDYLDNLEEDLYGDEDEECEIEEADDADGEDEECGCGCQDEDVEYVEVECPKCHDTICFEEDVLDDDDLIEVTCPNCNEVVYINDGSMPEPRRCGKAPKGEEEDL